jgi:hypothetical protein
LSTLACSSITVEQYAAIAVPDSVNNPPEMESQVALADDGRTAVQACRAESAVMTHTMLSTPKACSRPVLRKTSADGTHAKAHL